MALWSWLASLQGRRFQVYLYLFGLHIYHPLRTTYEQRYAKVAFGGSGGQAGFGRRHELAAGHSAGQSAGWLWRGLPRLWPALNWYRWASTIWMVYVITRNSIRESLVSAIDQLQLDMPATCYLLGRFQLAHGVERVSAILFVSYHLIWRYFQIFRPRSLRMSAIYFLILDDRDLARYHNLLANTTVDEESTCRQQQQQQQHHHHHHEREHEERQVREKKGAPFGVETQKHLQFMHEVMSYQIIRNSKTTYRLRPNRTLEASQRLRTLLIATNVIGTALFTPMALGVTSVILWQLFIDRPYLVEYGHCIEAQAQGGLRANWWTRYRSHQIAAYTADLFENYFIWAESCLACLTAPTMVLLLNQDLVVYWQHLHAKIEVSLEVVREHKRQSMSPEPESMVLNSSVWSNRLRQLAPWRLAGKTNERFEWDLDELILDLQHEFQDFIGQIEQADHIIGDFTSMMLYVWFSLFAFFTYSQQTQLMLAIKMTLSCVGLITTALYFSMLKLQQDCLKSYPKLCSLMALDTSEHRSRFSEILDYYVKKRTCYKFFRRVPMTGLQYMTYVGWSLSCLLLVLNKR